jgi:hypothetical protein
VAESETCSADEDAKKTDSECEAFDLIWLIVAMMLAQVTIQKPWVGQKKQYLSLCGVATEGSQVSPGRGQTSVEQQLYPSFCQYFHDQSDLQHHGRLYVFHCPPSSRPASASCA